MRAVVMLGMMILELGFAGQRARATDTPKDPCSLLSPAQMRGTLGDQYGAPEKSVAPRPFANTVQGTDCHYQSSRGQDQVLFRVYFDASVAQATDLHTRLKMFFGKNSTPENIGDEAYLDSNDAIHVRKGNVRYFLSISHGDTPSGRKQVLALAALVAGKL
ncbi:MAG TPA: hypothetical protein VNZ06_03255 [Steroidobacteraceae bacterium]|jgi:hypothetical protein|nr:hypothetical protein [Steroidobacteraceae bacterium]